MKVISKLVATAFVFLACVQLSVAQFDGKITMKMEAIDLPQEYAAMKSMFENSIVIYAKGNKSRTEMTQAMTGTSITINDVDKGESITCVDVMGQKMATKTTYDNSTKSEEELAQHFRKADGTKEIAGFKCYKGFYIVETNDTKQEMEVWYTMDIPNTRADMREIPGIPMEIFMEVQGIKLHYFVTEVKKEKVPSKMFELPEGYRIVTQEELVKKMMGQ